VEQAHVDGSSQQICGRGDGMDITSHVQVELCGWAGGRVGACGQAGRRRMGDRLEDEDYELHIALIPHKSVQR
jgi:hypothetical protein